MTSDILNYWPYFAGGMGVLVIIGYIAIVIDGREESGLANMRASKEYLNVKASKDFSIAKSEEEGRRHVGDIGEYVVNDGLEMLPMTATYWQLAGSFEGQRFEFDHLVVAPNGLFIVETKNYSGSITDNTLDGSWFRIGGGHNVLRNPMQQLERNRRILSNILTKWDLFIPIYGLAVMTGDCDLANVRNAPFPIVSAQMVPGTITQGVTGMSEATEDVLKFCARLGAAGIEPISYDLTFADKKAA